MTQDQSICIGCGLCCDGTLFGRFSLAGGDTDALLAAGVRLRGDAGADGHGFGRQPYGVFADGRCNAYAIRPTVCRTYRCKLLQSVEAGECSPADGRAIITEARSLAAEAKALLGPGAHSDSLLDQVRAMGLDRLDTAADRRQQAERLLAYGALQVFLAREFDDSLLSVAPGSDEPPPMA